MLAVVILVAAASSPVGACTLEAVVNGGFTVSHPGSLDVAVAVAKARRDGLLPPAPSESLPNDMLLRLMITDVRRMQARLGKGRSALAKPSTASFSLVLVGPGLGNSAATDDCLRLLQQAEIPMVIDASALRARFLRALGAQPRVITPHPGEAASLLDTSASAVQADRMASAAALVQEFGAVTVLKGFGTLIAAADATTAINTGGHAGMASAGMGDVLGGMIAALLAQGMEPAPAARAGVFLHAACADDFTREGAPECLIASDIIERLPVVMQAARDER